MSVFQVNLHTHRTHDVVRYIPRKRRIPGFKKVKDRGSYLLILNLRKERKIKVGKLGRVHFREGFYIYIGSAMVNLTKRMERHRRIRKQHHWHIDDLRAVAQFHSAIAIRSSARLECEIANALSKIAKWTIPKFGSSDCSCNTHLFGMSKDPLQSVAFHRLVQYFQMDRYHTNFPSPLLGRGKG